MRDLSEKLGNRKIKEAELLKYGFQRKGRNYFYRVQIGNNQFELQVALSKEKKYSKLIELENQTEFVLVDIDSAQGEFIGKLKQEYDEMIEKIVSECTSRETFQSNQAKEIICYVSKKYHDELEYLWEKFDHNAIWRNQKNKKWYGILLTISEEKLGIKSDKEVEIIDLRFQKENIENIIDGKTIFPGYHMNKKSWITIKLDDSMETNRICDLIDNSYRLSIRNSCKTVRENLSQEVYEYLTTIPRGKVVTYQQIAESLGNKGLARVVGNILHKNPDENRYPCYKVLNSKGELAEAFVFGGKKFQKRRLEQEGIQVENDKVDLSTYQWKP